GRVVRGVGGRTMQGDATRAGARGAFAARPPAPPHRHVTASIVDCTDVARYGRRGASRGGAFIARLSRRHRCGSALHGVTALH
ncbi:hypothetical protein, partial [Burkholderia ubonensis]|uniref:hypothetical protein n=1 Tax=Burkholderia ubonensis TaxID=101571 RepID=UPI001E57216E